jgi:UDP-N-acetyl-D-galactosamine dehydrogenase
MRLNRNTNICVIGLGYVGLPLAISFAKHFNVIGYDLDLDRVSTLKRKIDTTDEVSKTDFLKAKSIKFTSEISSITDIDIFIVTVPTPIFKNKNPDLRLLKKACNTVSKIIKKNNIVIFESTVYPGVTEEICAKIIEKKSGLKFNKEFFCGYSPERIDPGKSKHKLENIIKITSGSNKFSAKIVNKLYKKIINAGIFPTKSIKVAEAAKVIENTQRDLNISLVNELSILFNKLNINTNEVLNAAATKWNFINFRPGLVGGHCIGVDPYYLTYKSKTLGYKPKVILSGRKTNDEMSKYVSNKVISKLKNKNKNKKKISNQKILILGFAFKENCRDVRNTKVYDLYLHLKKRKLKVDIYDPLVNSNDVKKIYKIGLLKKLPKNNYDLIIIALGHKEFKKINKKYFTGSLIFDLKSIYKDLKSDFSF